MSTDSKLVEALRLIADCKFGMATADTYRLQEIAREALAAHEVEQEQAGEAVAWASIMAGQIMNTTHDKALAEQWKAMGGDVQPLYTRPQQPLSDEQIDAAFAEHDKQYPFFSSRWSFEAGIEFALGITKETNT